MGIAFHGDGTRRSRFDFTLCWTCYLILCLTSSSQDELEALLIALGLPQFKPFMVDLSLGPAQLEQGILKVVPNPLHFVYKRPPMWLYPSIICYLVI